jgi:hypothetical protein
MLQFGDSVYEAELRRNAVVAQEEAHRGQLAATDRVTKYRSAWDEHSRRLVTRLGGLMVDWGCELQSRYAAESSRGLS